MRILKLPFRALARAAGGWLVIGLVLFSTSALANWSLTVRDRHHPALWLELVQYGSTSSTTSCEKYFEETIFRLDIAEALFWDCTNRNWSIGIWTSSRFACVAIDPSHKLAFTHPVGGEKPIIILMNLYASEYILDSKQSGKIEIFIDGRGFHENDDYIVVEPTPPLRYRYSFSGSERMLEAIAAGYELEVFIEGHRWAINLRGSRDAYNSSFECAAQVSEANN